MQSSMCTYDRIRKYGDDSDRTDEDDDDDSDRTTMLIQKLDSSCGKRHSFLWHVRAFLFHRLSLFLFHRTTNSRYPNTTTTIFHFHRWRSTSTTSRRSFLFYHRHRHRHCHRLHSTTTSRLCTTYTMNHILHFCFFLINDHQQYQFGPYHGVF